jgi:hypothetical protein
MPRIRTIKPEFWRNRQLANLSPFTRLLAIALLNVADDEGYFEADVALIRGDVFPFEKDCVNIHGGLTELSRIGYVEIREHSSKGQIGLILAFQKHQVINRPSPSKLSDFFEESAVNYRENDDSLKTHGVLIEGSLLEQGTGNREKEREHDICSESQATSKPKQVDEPLFDLEFKTTGKDKVWKPPQSLVDKLVQMYDTLDIPFQLRAASMWCETNDKKRKTPQRMGAFLTNWMNKAVERQSQAGGYNGAKSTKSSKPDLPPITDREMTFDEFIARF